MSVLGGDFSSYSDSGPRIMGTRQQIASVCVCRESERDLLRLGVVVEKNGKTIER